MTALVLATVARPPRAIAAPLAATLAVATVLGLATIPLAGGEATQ